MSTVYQYLYWAVENNIPLINTPTQQELNVSLAQGDMGEYNVSYGIDILWQLGAYQFLH